MKVPYRTYYSKRNHELFLYYAYDHKFINKNDTRDNNGCSKNAIFEQFC